MALISFLLIERWLRLTIGRFDSQSLCAGDEGDEQSGAGYLTRADAQAMGDDCFRIPITDRIAIVGEHDDSGRVIEAHIRVSYGRNSIDFDPEMLADLHEASYRLESLSDPGAMIRP